MRSAPNLNDGNTVLEPAIPATPEPHELDDDALAAAAGGWIPTAGNPPAGWGSNQTVYTKI